MNNDINEKIVHAAPVPPFVRFVASAVPMVFDNSLSYYECLCALWKWMQDNLVDVINNNATVTEHYIDLDLETRALFNQLKTYVDTYFDNLDVQDEINNKLDEMAEAGTLQEIITTYIQSNVAWTFDTVADMKQATNLVDGSYARTLGFHSVNDGGGALYHITNSGTANEMDIIAIDSLRAHLILTPVVTPEMYGAYGDGTHDDTSSWQKAVDSAHDVKAMHTSYLTGKIEVTTNNTIDCNYASFTCSADTLFEIKGEVTATINGESNYTARSQNYQISDSTYDTYTGYALIEGDNNFQESRAYYVGGFVGYFKNGKLDASYPIAVTNPTIYLINPIEGELKNITNITHSTPNTSTVSIKVLYGYGYSVKNIKNDTSECYICVQLSKCMNCNCDNLVVTQHFDSDNDNSYIVDIADSSFCSVTNSTLHNDLWHAITTGGTILCYANTIENCHMTSNVEYAFLDHDNARGTTVRDCTSQCLSISGLGTVDNVIVLSNNDTYKRCLIRLSLISEVENADYTITNCKLQPASDSTDSYRGIQPTVSPQVNGKTYYLNNLNIDNVKGVIGTGSSLRFNVNSSSSAVINNISINNSNLDVFIKSTSATNIDVSNSKLSITNCKEKTGTHYINIGGSNYVYNDITIENSNLWRIYGTYTTLTLDNVELEADITGTNTTVTNLYGGNIRSFIRQDCILACTNVMINAMKRTTNDKWFNICNTGTGKFYQHMSGTSMITEEVTYS